MPTHRIWWGHVLVGSRWVYKASQSQSASSRSFLPSFTSFPSLLYLRPFPPLVHSSVSLLYLSFSSLTKASSSHSPLMIIVVAAGGLMVSRSSWQLLIPTHCLFVRFLPIFESSSSCPSESFFVTVTYTCSLLVFVRSLPIFDWSVQVSIPLPVNTTMQH